MLRELAEAMEVLTTECPLILALEDMHWSDTATLDWLSYVARRWEPAGLLMGAAGGGIFAQEVQGAPDCGCGRTRRLPPVCALPTGGCPRDAGVERVRRNGLARADPHQCRIFG
jgi:hypothetical protein